MLRYNLQANHKYGLTSLRLAFSTKYYKTDNKITYFVKKGLITVLKANQEDVALQIIF